MPKPFRLYACTGFSALQDYAKRCAWMPADVCVSVSIFSPYPLFVLHTPKSFFQTPPQLISPKLQRGAARFSVQQLRGEQCSGMQWQKAASSDAKAALGRRTAAWGRHTAAWGRSGGGVLVILGILCNTVTNKKKAGICCIHNNGHSNSPTSGSKCVPLTVAMDLFV